MKPRWARTSRAPTPPLQMAVFTLGSLEYAIDIMEISRIIRPQPVRPVPRAPAFVDGVIELRGLVIPVMDLRRRFGLTPDSGPRGEKFVIVRFEGRPIALVVDRVLGVHSVLQSSVRRTPGWIAGAESAVFSGVCRWEDHLVLILDLGKLITSQERISLQDLDLSSLEEVMTEEPPPGDAPRQGAET